MLSILNDLLLQPYAPDKLCWSISSWLLNLPLQPYSVYRKNSQMFFVSFSLVTYHPVLSYCMVILSLPHRRTQLVQKEQFHLQQLGSTFTFGCQHQKIEINDNGLFSVFLKLMELWQSYHILLHQLSIFETKPIYMSLTNGESSQN